MTKVNPQFTCWSAVTTVSILVSYTNNSQSPKEEVYHYWPAQPSFRFVLDKRSDIDRFLLERKRCWGDLPFWCQEICRSLRWNMKELLWRHKTQKQQICDVGQTKVMTLPRRCESGPMHIATCLMHVCVCKTLRFKIYTCVILQWRYISGFNEMWS